MASESLADIVAEMRELAADIEAGNAVVGQTVWRNYADRIEAAAKRMEQTYLDQIRDAINQWGHEKYKAEHASVGNAAARGVCNDGCKFANVNRRLGWQKIGQARCFPFWAQMSYEEGGAK